MYDKNNPFNYKFQAKDKINEAMLKQHIIDLCEYENILAKKITIYFSRNKFLYDLTTKEDVKQEIILYLLQKCLFTLPFMNKEEKMKSFNIIVNRRIIKVAQQHYKYSYIQLDENMLIDKDYNMYKNDIENILSIFANDKIEREIVELLVKGYNDNEIIKMLDIGRTTFYNYKKKIKKQLKERET